MNNIKWATVGPVQMLYDVALTELKEWRTADVFFLIVYFNIHCLWN